MKQKFLISIIMVFIHAAFPFYLVFSQGVNVEMTSFLKIDYGDADGSIFYYNNYLYMPGNDDSWNSGVYIVEVSDVENPEYIGFAEASYGNMDFSGNYMYMTDDELYVYSLTDPEAPIEISSCNVGSGYATKVKIQGNYAFVGCYGEPGERGGLSVIDISNPLNPQEVGFWTAPAGYFEPNDIVLNLNNAFIATWTGIYIIDITNLANPIFETEYQIPGEGYGLDISSNILYVAYGGAGVKILNVSNVGNINELGGYFLPGDACAYSVHLNGTKAYVGYGIDGFRIVDISNPALPIETGYYDTPFYAEGIALNGDYAFLFQDGWVEIFDCSQAINYISPGDGNTPSVVTLLPPSPNPFNAETKISYTISNDCEMSLLIFDINGRVVQKLFEGFQSAGLYNLEFGSNDLPSGVYFARLQAGEFSQTQKLLLIK